MRTDTCMPAPVRRRGPFAGPLGLIVGVLSAVAGLLAILERLRPRGHSRDEGLAGVRTALGYVALPLAPLSLVARRPILGLLSAIAGAPAIEDLRQRRAVPVPPTIRPVRELTVLTYDLGGSADVADLLRLAQMGNADLVAVQGLGHAAREGLQAAAREAYPYSSLEARDDPRAGVGLLSRHPILTQEYWPHRRGAAVQGNLRAEISLAGARVAVYNVHPPDEGAALPGAAAAAVEAVLSRVEAERGPVLLVGDLYPPEGTDLEGRLAARFVDTRQESLGGGPSDGPCGRILHSTHLQGVWLRTGAPNASGVLCPAWASLLLPLPEHEA
jgi:endonuclease/exonuclease/phosphatase (EEP) superfamily protein YafD